MDILGSFQKLKSSILHGAGHALRFKGDAYNSLAQSIDMVADGVNPRAKPSYYPTVKLADIIYIT